MSSCSPLRTRKMAMQVFHSNSFALVLGFGSLIFLVLVSLGCRFCMAWVCCRCPCHRRCGCACGRCRCRCRCGCACFQFKAAPDFQQSPRHLNRECFATSRVKKNAEYSNCGYFIGLWLFGEPSETFSFPFH